MKRFTADPSHRILPVPMDNLADTKIPPNLIHGNCLFLAPTASGKSFLIGNAITRPSFGYIAEFDRIILMSPTAWTDRMWTSMLDSPYAKHIEIIPEYDEKFLIELMDTQDAAIAREKAEKKARKRKGKAGAPPTFRSSDTTPSKDFMSAIENMITPVPDDGGKLPPLFKALKVLIILDDVADAMPSSNSRTVLDRLAFRGRHAQITLFLAVQSFKRTPRNIRINIKNVVIFSINDSELQKVSEELAQESVETFKEIVHFATREPYSFLFLNTRAPKNERYRLRFGDFIVMQPPST
jgi:hypothetical protein